MNFSINQTRVQNFARPAAINKQQLNRQQIINKQSFKLKVQTKESGGVFKYLQDAFKSIFSAEKSDVDWSKTYADFSSKASQLDQRRLEVIADRIQQIKGCTDPKASNYNSGATLDDGSCTFDASEEEKRVSLAEYLQNIIKGTWEHNFEKSNPDETIPKFQSWSFEGRIVSQRDIDRMLEFEKAVKTAIKEKKEKGEK